MQPTFKCNIHLKINIIFRSYKGMSTNITCTQVELVGEPLNNILSKFIHDQIEKTFTLWHQRAMNVCVDENTYIMSVEAV